MKQPQQNDEQSGDDEYYSQTFLKVINLLKDVPEEQRERLIRAAAVYFNVQL